MGRDMSRMTTGLLHNVILHYQQEPCTNPWHCAALCRTAPHCAALHCIVPHCAALCCILLHNNGTTAPCNFAPQQEPCTNPLQSTAFHCILLHDNGTTAPCNFAPPTKTMLQSIAIYRILPHDNGITAPLHHVISHRQQEPCTNLLRSAAFNRITIGLLHYVSLHQQ